jgi:hypothetical protein
MSRPGAPPVSRLAPCHHSAACSASACTPSTAREGEDPEPLHMLPQTGADGFGGRVLFRVNMFAHNNSGIAYQDGN